MNETLVRLFGSWNIILKFHIYIFDIENVTSTYLARHRSLWEDQSFAKYVE